MSYTLSQQEADIKSRKPMSWGSLFKVLLEIQKNQKEQVKLLKSIKAQKQQIVYLQPQSSPGSQS